MDKLFLKTLALSFAIYTATTIPYIIWIVSMRKQGINYPFWAIILCGIVSNIIAFFITNKNKTNG